MSELVTFWDEPDPDDPTRTYGRAAGGCATCDGGGCGDCTD